MSGFAESMNENIPRGIVSGVYAIVCTQGNEIEPQIYVGCSQDIRSRLCNHRCMLNKGRHHSAGLQAAWNKYGESAFCCLWLQDEWDYQERRLAEVEWARELNATLNSIPPVMKMYLGPIDGNPHSCRVVSGDEVIAARRREAEETARELC